MLDMSKFWKSLQEAANNLAGTVIEETMQPGDCHKRWPGTIKSAMIETEQGTVQLHYVNCYGWCQNV